MQVGATAAAGVTASVSVDGVAFTEALPVAVGGDGVHTVVAEASDGSRVETAFVIDTSGHVVTITASPGATSGTSATIAFTLSEPGTTACTFDGNPYAPCSSSVALTGLGNGGGNNTVDVGGGIDNVTTARQRPDRRWPRLRRLCAGIRQEQRDELRSLNDRAAGLGSLSDPRGEAARRRARARSCSRRDGR